MNCKHSKKMTLSVSVVSLLIISFCMSLFLFSTDVKAAVYGPKYYYLSIERQNLRDAMKELKQSYIDQNLSEYSYAGNLSAALKGDFVNSNESLKKIADFLSKFELNYNYNINGKNIDDIYYTSTVSTKYNGQAFADIDVKSADNKVLITLPGLTDKSIGITASNNISSKLNKAILFDDDEAFEELFGLTREAYNNLLTKYLKDVIFKQIPNEQVTYLKDVQYKKMTCNAITFNIDEETISNIYLELAKELRNDEEFSTLYKSIANSFNQMASELYQIDIPSDIDYDYDYEIQEMCDELEYQAEMIDDVQIAYTVYFKNNGDILFRQIDDKLSDTKVALETYKDLSETEIIRLNVESFDQNFIQFTNEEKLVNGNCTGKFSLNMTEMLLADGTYTYEKDAKVGNLDAFVGEVKGNIYLEQFNALYQTQMSDIIFAYTNQRKGEDTLLGEAKVTTAINNQSFEAVVSTEIKQSDKANISKPNISLEGTTGISTIDGMAGIGIDIFESLSKKFPDLMTQLDFGSLYDNGLYDYDEIYDY